MSSSKSNLALHRFSHCSITSFWKHLLLLPPSHHTPCLVFLLLKGALFLSLLCWLFIIIPAMILLSSSSGLSSFVTSLSPVALNATSKQVMRLYF